MHAAPGEADMDTKQRIDQLEARLDVLERERAAEQLRLRRDRRMRMALLIILGGAYLIYLMGIFRVMDAAS